MYRFHATGASLPCSNSFTIDDPDRLMSLSTAWRKASGAASARSGNSSAIEAQRIHSQFMRRSVTIRSGSKLQALRSGRSFRPPGLVPRIASVSASPARSDWEYLGVSGRTLARSR